MAPHGRDGQGDVGVGTEEGEGHQAPAQDGGGQAPGGAQRAGRQQPAQRREPDRDADRRQPEAEQDIVRAQRPQNEGGPERGADGVGDAVLLGRGLVGTTETDECRHGDRPGDGDQGDEAEEHPAPSEEMGHRGGHAGSDDARDHPGGGEDRHHPGPLRLAQAPPDGDVGHRRHGPGTEPLQAASGHEHPHEGGEAGDEEPGREQHQARDIRSGRAVTVRVATRSHDPDQAGQLERREDPAIERQSVQVAGHHRHHRDDGQCLRGDEGHAEHQAERQRAPLRCPQPVAPNAPVHAGETRGNARWYSAPGRAM